MNSMRHNRHSLRLPGHDYSAPGDYFITIALQGSDYFLGALHWKNIRLNEIGKSADQFWREIPRHFNHVVVDEYVIMPDHLHGILRIIKHPENHDTHTPRIHSPRHAYQNVIPGSISYIVAHFKAAIKRWCNKNGYPEFRWQRNFYERIIRDIESLEKTREYIRANPSAGNETDKE